MKNIVKIGQLSVAALVLFVACKKEEVEPDPDPSASTKSIKLNVSGLEDLGNDYVYEGWIMVDGSPVSTGTFSVDGNGTLSKTSFSVAESDANGATAFILSIEPANDSDPAPSDVKILGGAVSNNAGNISIDHMAALGNDFGTSKGKYIIATPTDGMNNNELSGVWFLDVSAGPGPGLTLPTLPAGWEYEGWSVINGTPVTTGKFTNVSGSDAAAPYSGTMDAPPFPGEDFLNNAPSGLTFPTDLSGATMVISIEPVPDNSAAPFLLKPLVGMAPATAAAGTSYDMNLNTASFPTGNVTIE